MPRLCQRSWGKSTIEKALGEHRDKDALEDQAGNGLKGGYYALWTIGLEWR